MNFLIGIGLLTSLDGAIISLYSTGALFQKVQYTKKFCLDHKGVTGLIIHICPITLKLFQEKMEAS